MKAPAIRWSVGLALMAFAAPAAAQQEPVRLQLPEARRLNGQAYALEMFDSIVIDAHGAPHNAARAARFRFHFSDAGAEADARVSASLTIDSLTMSLGTPHGDEVSLTHGLAGTRVPLQYRRTGGGASYADDVPLVDFSDMGGAFPLSSLIDPVFPALASRPVRVGDSWEQWWVRRRIDGGAASERQVTSRYTLAALEMRDGETVARVIVSTRGDAVPGLAAAGAVEASGFVVIRVSDGVVLEVSSEETVGGLWGFEGESFPYRQRARVRAVNTSLGRTSTPE
jgi:hypothetical protein